MKKQLIKVLSIIISVYLAEALFSSIEVGTIYGVLSFSIVLGLLSLLLRPLMLLITLPINLVTFGVFSVIVNTVLVIIADKLIKSVYIPGFWISLLLALLITGVFKVLKYFLPVSKIQA